MLAVTNNNYGPYIAATTTRRANRPLRDERRLWLAGTVTSAGIHLNRHPRPSPARQHTLPKMHYPSQYSGTASDQVGAVGSEAVKQAKKPKGLRLEMGSFGYSCSAVRCVAQIEDRPLI